MQLLVSMCKTCTQHRLTQPELARGRESRNRVGKPGFSEVYCPSLAAPLLCHDSLGEPRPVTQSESWIPIVPVQLPLAVAASPAVSP